MTLIFSLLLCGTFHVVMVRETAPCERWMDTHFNIKIITMMTTLTKATSGNIEEIEDVSKTELIILNYAIALFFCTLCRNELSRELRNGVTHLHFSLALSCCCF
jgi:hypothetical protein